VPLRILAHRGDSYLGGDDIDVTLANYAADVVLRGYGWDLRSDAEVFARLVFEAEAAKLRLANVETTQIELANIDAAAPGTLTGVPIDRSAVLQLSSGLIRRTFSLCDEVLSQAGLGVKDIQAVFLAGGTTMLPGVRDTVAQYFGRKLRYELDPMHVVALGASIVAARHGLASLLAPG
jgi:molecular chaperone DnaK